MKNNRISFQLIHFLILFFLFCCLSCGRSSNIPPHLDHDFLFGTSEGLYRIRDLRMILDEEALKFQKDTDSDRHYFEDYEKILSAKENLYEKDVEANISSLNELLRIRTAKRGEKVKVSSGLKNIFIDPDLPFLNEYELLDYKVIKPETNRQKTLKKLLGRVKEFKGFPDTDYYILPQLRGNYLILYKLASADKIPYDELPLARRIGDMLAVPFVGYPVEYCQAVKVLGSNNIKETLKSRPLCKSAKPSESVKYVRLWEHSKQVFQYLQKLNFFQKDFFEGQWFHYKTLVRSPSGQSENKKHNLFRGARLVKFYPSLGKMDVVEVHNLKKDDEKRVLFIPVKWTDYEIARDSEKLDPSFSERLKDTNEINRPYLEVKFNELITNEFEHGEKGGKALKSVVITKDYISFDIEISTKGRVAYLMKYAFKRYIEDADYKEKKWFRTDSLLFFPLHSVKRKYYEDPADHTRSDVNRFKRAVRFDSQSKELLWYFSKSSSRMPWVREMGYEVEDLLNKALQEAGRDSDYQIKITLDKSGSDKELGDIRYNVLNLILSEDETPEQFRWGPNVANPVTGKAVSATATVWLTPILSEYISLIRRYIRFQVYPPAWKMKPFSQETMDFIHENVETKNLQCSDSSQELFSVTPFLHEKINIVCGEVSDFIKRNQGKEFHPTRNSSLRDEDVVKSCAQKLARARIMQSILHSMLHSLGLKDMLSASFDSENFYKHNEIEDLFGKKASEVITASHPDPPQYSSVMDYIDLRYPVLPVPGKLDIAALRFLYFDKLDLKKQTACCPLREEAGVLEVPSGADKDPENPQKSILETALAKNYKKEDIKEYKMCGEDEWNPLFCGKYDYGVSPLEIVSNVLCKIHENLLSARNRYNANEIESNKMDTIFMTRIYLKWKEYRDNILARQGKSILDYSFLNPDHIEEYNQIMEEARKAPDINAYYMIRKPIFNYFRRLIFTPVKHCIYRESSDRDNTFHYKAIALEAIEEKILRQYPENSEKESEVFINCESPVVKDWAEGQGELVAEVGFFGKSRRYSLRPNEKTDPIDEIPAFRFIFDRNTSYTDMLQDLEFGDEYYREWLAYVTQGIDLNPYIDRDSIKDPLTPKDIQLERVLSYKMDTEAVKIDTNDNLWSSREGGITSYINRLQTDYSNVENLQLSQFHFSYQIFSVIQLRELTVSIQGHSGLHSDTPFLTQVYEEYEAQEGEMSFARFIQTHPAVIYDSEDSLFFLPYVDNELNVMSKLFRRYNEFLKCVEEHEVKTCDQIEDKKAFIKLMLDIY